MGRGNYYRCLLEILRIVCLESEIVMRVDCRNVLLRGGIIGDRFLLNFSFDVRP